LATVKYSYSDFLSYILGEWALNKLEKLKELLKPLPGAVIAYSAGVDSTFLTVVAREVLGEQALAVTAVSPTYPEQQLSDAREVAARFKINHMALFQELKKIAEAKGGWVLMDGANLDDLSDHRPGHRAAKELGVRSPLQEVGMTKQEIRDFSKELSLPTWDKPAYACLASRVPYGNEITPAVLKRIELAENFLTSLGLVQIRVRDHFPLARIEVGKTELDLAWGNRDLISRKLHEIGYPYVTLDLDGFRSGSMNEVIIKKE